MIMLKQAQFICAAGKRLNAGSSRGTMDKATAKDLGIVKVDLLDSASMSVMQDAFEYA